MNKRGGKREGAGRKPSPYGKTKSVKVPLTWLDDFKEWIEQMKQINGGQDNDIAR